MEEGKKAFEQACKQREIRLFVLSSRSLKRNGHVEKARGTHAEEFYEGCMRGIWLYLS